VKFVGFYQGPPSGYGPPSFTSGGVEISNTWQSTGSYAIGDDGQVYALTYKYSDSWAQGAAQKLYWLRITAEVVSL
jgi:hypothetical protein